MGGGFGGRGVKDCAARCGFNGAAGPRRSALTKIRSAGVANRDFFVFLGDKTPKSDAQVSQIVILDKHPLGMRRKRLLF